MEQPIIRLATIEDLPAVRALWKALVTEAPPAYPQNLAGSIDAFTRSVALALTATPASAFVFLGQLPGSLTPDAFLAYEIQERAIGEPARLAFVHYCYTRPPARRSGLATTICELATEHMAAHGLTHVEITTLPGDKEWDAFGFTPYEVRSYVRLPHAALAIEQRRRGWANGLDRSGVEEGRMVPRTAEEGTAEEGPDEVSDE
jgi:hypothetical protein